VSSLLDLLDCILTALVHRRSPFIDRKVVKNCVIRPDWTEIQVDEPLKPIGDYQQIGLYLAEPFKMDLDEPFGIRVPDGSLVVPEVELVAADGRVAPMKRSGARGTRSINYRLQDESLKQDYVRIRLRADQDIPLDAIFWSGIVIKNMP